MCHRGSRGEGEREREGGTERDKNSTICLKAVNCIDNLVNQHLDVT